MLYVTGKMSCIVDLETIFLQKLGPPCVAAYNAYNMCIEMKQTKFIAMDARHCAGSEMSDLMSYGASVGSEKAIRKLGAKGLLDVQQMPLLIILVKKRVLALCHMH